MFRKFVVIIILNIVFFDSYSQIITDFSKTSFSFEKYIIKNNNKHSSIKPYSQKEIYNKLDSVYEQEINNSRFFKEKIFNKNTFFLKKNKTEIKINPHFSSIGIYEQKKGESLYNLELGASCKASFFEKFYFSGNYFYTKQKLNLNESQFADSFNIKQQYGNFLNKNNRTIDFLTGEFQLSYVPNNNFTLEIGKGSNFLGNGYRSLFLSDNSRSYPHFKATIEFWKVKYVWILAKLKDFNLIGAGDSNKMFDKYAAIHYVSLDFTKRINLIFFEAIITNPQDKFGNRGLDVNYINPVIFYRPVEFNAGDNDNALIGFGLNIKLWKTTSLYSQLIIDEFKFKEIKSRSGWFGNKQGIQAGFKTYNFLNINNLFVRLEYNRVRPYAFSHRISNLSYGNYRTPLPHPFGSNFTEILSQIIYQYKRFSFQIKASKTEQGIDFDNFNYGGDIYKSYIYERDSELNAYGNTHLQGLKTETSQIDVNISILLNHNFGTSLIGGITISKVSNSILTMQNNYIYFGIYSEIYSQKSDIFK